MAYFSKFPTLSYDFTTQTDVTPIVETGIDVSTRISLVVTDQDFADMTQRYTIASGEMPEHVSFGFYGTPDLAWTILYINGIGNINAEWPLSDIDLNEFIATKYGVQNVNNIHHYEKLPEGVVMDRQFIIDNYGQNSLLPVTNTDYEIEKNEQKRYIYIIKPSFISVFVKNYMAKLA